MRNKWIPWFIPKRYCSFCEFSLAKGKKSVQENNYDEHKYFKYEWYEDEKNVGAHFMLVKKKTATVEGKLKLK